MPNEEEWITRRSAIPIPPASPQTVPQFHLASEFSERFIVKTRTATSSVVNALSRSLIPQREHGQAGEAMRNYPAIAHHWIESDVAASTFLDACACALIDAHDKGERIPLQFAKQ
jgi:hypothetical protein